VTCPHREGDGEDTNFGDFHVVFSFPPYNPSITLQGSISPSMGEMESEPSGYFFFLWRFCLNFLRRLWVAIFNRFRFLPEGMYRTPSLKLSRLADNRQYYFKSYQVLLNLVSSQGMKYSIRTSHQAVTERWTLPVFITYVKSVELNLSHLPRP